MRVHVCVRACECVAGCVGARVCAAGVCVVCVRACVGVCARGYVSVMWVWLLTVAEVRYSPRLDAHTSCLRACRHHTVGMGGALSRAGLSMMGV